MTRIPSLSLSQSVPPTSGTRTSQEKLRPRLSPQPGPRPRLRPKVDMTQVESPAPSPRKELSAESSPRVGPTATSLQRIATFKPRESGKPQRAYRSPRSAEEKKEQGSMPQSAWREKERAESVGAEKAKPSPRERKTPRTVAESKSPRRAPEASKTTEIKEVNVQARIKLYEGLSPPQFPRQAPGRPSLRRPLPTIPSAEIEVTVSKPEKKSDILS